MTVSVIEATGNQVSGAYTTSLATPPASDTEALLVVYFGEPGIGIASFTIGGDSARDYLDVSPQHMLVDVQFAMVARLYPLEAGDEHLALTPSDQYKAGCVAFLQLSDFAAIPADIEDQGDAAEYVPTDVIGLDATMIAPGLLVAGGAILPEPVAMTVPSGWTQVSQASGLYGQYQLAYAGGLSGLVADAWVDGTVPTGGAGYVAWVGVQDIGLRHREAGAWIAATSYGLPETLATPNARQFPEPDALPRTPPQPTPIVVPTPPWDTSRSPHRRRG